MRHGLIAAVLLTALVPAAGRERLSSADRMRRDLTYLAGDECQGRGLETDGINRAAVYIAAKFKEAGLQPGGPGGEWFQPFSISGAAKLTSPNRAALTGPDGKAVELARGEAFNVCGLTGKAEAEAEVVFAGYGITTEDYDDYAGLDVEGKVVVVLRRTPRPGARRNGFPNGRRFSSLNSKLVTAARKKAAGLIFVSDAFTAATADDLMPFGYAARGAAPAKLPVIHIKRRVFDRMIRSGLKRSLRDTEKAIDKDMKPRSGVLKGWKAKLVTSVVREKIQCKNVIGVLPGVGDLAGETVVVGGHYDHLGRGERGSLARGGDRRKTHYGADDNGSGTTAVIELARRLAAKKGPRRRMVFMTFSGEEQGLLGSKHYADNPVYPLKDTVAMVNLDMVGRLRDGKVELGGTGTAQGFDGLVDRLNRDFNFKFKKTASGVGPSDHTSFYQKKVPVFFLFTGLHKQYHRPSDTVDTINFDGMERIVNYVERLTDHLSKVTPRPKYQVTRGRIRPGGRPRGPRLGFMPGRYGEGGKGLPVTSVTEGGPAEKGGMKDGDVIVEIGGQRVTNIVTYMRAMSGEKAGRPVEVIVLRKGKKVKLKVTPQ